MPIELTDLQSSKPISGMTVPNFKEQTILYMLLISKNQSFFGEIVYRNSALSGRNLEFERSIH